MSARLRVQNIARDTPKITAIRKFVVSKADSGTLNSPITARTLASITIAASEATIRYALID